MNQLEQRLAELRPLLYSLRAAVGEYENHQNMAKAMPDSVAY